MATHICKHDELLLDVSDFGVRAGFRQASAGALAAAATEHNQVKKASKDGAKPGDPHKFPAPLILPNDDLALEEDDPQSFHEFTQAEERNVPTPERTTIYLVAPPRIEKSISFVRSWIKPKDNRSVGPTKVSPEHIYQRVFEYITAFYHGMPVKMYEGILKFSRYGRGTSQTPNKIDIAFDGNLLDIRTRACPDGAFSRQLNVNDLLDVLIELLPSDAYAVMMLVDHDIWEDDEDVFTCGRAYGGSRVSVVSTARYNPSLDADIGWDTKHAWPASHCRDYIDQVISNFESDHGQEAAVRKVKRKAVKKRGGLSNLSRRGTGPLRAAVDAHLEKWPLADTDSDLTHAARLWMSRVCKTASHELGHCLGIEHCTYYACVMQGTAGLHEDARQPPYLCPVDQAKLLSTTGVSVDDRNKCLLELFERMIWKDEPMFAAYAAWIGPAMDRANKKGSTEGDAIVLE